MTREHGSVSADVFAFLGNEDRLAILEALYDHSAAAGTLTGEMAYTELRRAVGIEDSGRFNYHLGKLTDRFVDKSDAGYRLREPGRNVVQVSRSGVFSDGVQVEATPVDATCYRCGGGVVAAYEHGHLVVRCRECPGLIREGTLPHGTLSAVGLPPAAVESGDVATAFERAHLRDGDHIRRMGTGICITCCGDVRHSLDVCRDHRADADSLCANCGLWHPAFARHVCEVCGHRRATHPLYAHTETESVADALGDVAPGWERFAALMRWDVEVRDSETVVFEASDGRSFLVDDDLRVAVETLP